MADNLVSVSDLCSYLWCRRQLYINKVYGIREPFKRELSLGSIHHAVHDAATKIEKQIILCVQSPEQAHIESVFRENYASALRNALVAMRKDVTLLGLDMSAAFRQLWPAVLEESRQRALAVSGVALREGVSGARLWTIFFPKTDSERYITSRALGIKGIIDRVEKYPDIIVPVELKTGKMPKEGVWPTHRVQIAAYMLLLSEAEKTPAIKGIVEYLEFKERREVVYNPFMKEEIAKLREAVVALLSSGNIPPGCGRRSCIYCARSELPSDIDALKAHFDKIFSQRQQNAAKTANGASSSAAFAPRG